MSSLTLDYDRVKVSALLADRWSEYGETMAQFDVRDRSARREGIELMRSLLDDLREVGNVWHLVGAKTMDVSVHAEYFCDGDGGSTNDDYLTLAIFMGVGAGVADVGIDSLAALPHLEMRGVFDVLDGVAMLLTESIRRVASVVAPPPPELSLRVVTVESVRAEADEDPFLNESERAALRDASVEQISEAVRVAWTSVEERFFAVHDEIRAAATRAVLAASAPIDGRG